jgi:hypothetical protein
VARVWVHREDLITGDLPPVCVRTGDPTDELVAVRLDSLPEWTWILLLFGVVPFLIAAIFATERVPGRLPMSLRARERRRGHRRRVWAAGAVAFGLFVVAAVAQTSWPFWFALGALVVVLGSLLGLERSLPSARPDRTGLGVHLRRVHPAFVEAVAQRRHAPGLASP